MALGIALHQASVAEGEALLAERVNKRRWSLMLDHRVRGSAAQIVGLSVVPKSAAEEVALIDPSHEDGRWQALMALQPATLIADLSDLVQIFQIWMGAPEGLDTLDLATHAGELEEPLSIQDFLLWLYYDSRRDRARFALRSDESVGVWRKFLRHLGEGPASVFQDPWFGRLFLSGGDPFPFDTSFVLVNLQAPRTPAGVACRIATVAVHRALSILSRNKCSEPAELGIFVVDDSVLASVAEKTVRNFAAMRPEALPDAQVHLWTLAGPYDQESAPSEVAKAIVNLTRLKHAREGDSVESALYAPLPVRVDKWHRPDYVKGLMYGFQPFCVIDPDEELSPTIKLFKDEGIELGASLPLLELYDDF
jgi:hypothetical protein